ncbi:dCTP deaminase [Deinococcus peraridilitoris]|uniref:dCTP deaminase n=1 Tax=Deinococcus peraridilitoris (strain DSM 19664 / LMG 22246 / CIP 109416 / KR-200) TaxID=937777 RepID=K9ZX40_DEIPD|nr:dCTP deaminase [Deinococcus peraridilitoris]AFZ66213.1 deoxycytidine triphosphate deaminase [Deinococcus peraridilitoris DSM 19664]
MSIRPDWWIRERAREGMIEPFSDNLVRKSESGRGIISFGLSSFGYDLRAAPEWRIFVNAFNTVVDPKSFDVQSLVEFDGDECIIPPNSFVLTRSVEYLRIPDTVMVVALGKSSYARCGIVANVTPLEPGWEGHVTLELSNTTPLPAKVYANEGIVQLLFFEGDRPDVTYRDRQGKYQGQTGVTLPKL